MRRGNANAVDELMLVDGVKHDVGDDTLWHIHMSCVVHLTDMW